MRSCNSMVTDDERMFAWKEKIMKGNARRQKAKTKRKAKINSLTKFVLSVMVVAAVVCIILFSNKNVTNADESGEAVQLTKYFKTITIEKGDSLWSIANEYKSGDYRRTEDYVNELKSMNNLHSDQIRTGQKLVVAYFAE